MHAKSRLIDAHLFTSFRFRGPSAPACCCIAEPPTVLLVLELERLLGPNMKPVALLMKPPVYCPFLEVHEFDFRYVHGYGKVANAGEPMVC